MDKPRRPQRTIWELNNKNAAFWGQPLQPEPEGGFADDEVVVPLLDEVKDWFRDAVPKFQMHPQAAKDIERIAWLVSEWRLQEPYLYNKQENCVLDKKIHALRRDFAKLMVSLRKVLDVLAQAPLRGDPYVARLVNLWNAAVLTELDIAPPPKQGPQLSRHSIMIKGLEEPIRRALASAGHPRASSKNDGPLVRIIRRALFVIEGLDHESTAIESVLKRRRKKRSTIS
jgi:hypothetical protein